MIPVRRVEGSRTLQGLPRVNYRCVIFFSILRFPHLGDCCITFWFAWALAWRPLCLLLSWLSQVDGSTFLLLSLQTSTFRHPGCEPNLWPGRYCHLSRLIWAIEFYNLTEFLLFFSSRRSVRKRRPAWTAVGSQGKEKIETSPST